MTLRLRLAALLALPAVAAALVSQVSLTAGLICGLALAMAAAIYLASIVSSPLQNVAAAARAIATGNYSARVRRLPGEAATLTEAFNAMALQVQGQMSTASQERGRLAAALNSSIDAVVALDRSGRVLFANLAAQTILGPSGSAVEGSQVAGILPDEDVVESVRASRDRSLQSCNLIELSGRRFFHVVTTPIVDGGDWAVLLVLHDVTDVQRTDQMRRDFVANVSHELRTPLAGIKAVVETLTEGALDDREAAVDFLTRADAEIDRLILLVEELLELSRIETGEIPLAFERTEIDRLVRDVAERMQQQAERNGVSLAVECEPDVFAEVDPVRLERALLNLVHNAIKSTAAGGAVKLSSASEGDIVCITVVDNGSGIDGRDIPRVFERFYKADSSRSSGGGSGIGLAIVKHTVEAHGGSISLESEPGKGSSFAIQLPLRRR